MRAFRSYGIVDRPSDRLCLRTVPLYGCIERRSCYRSWIRGAVEELSLVIVMDDGGEFSGGL